MVVGIEESTDAPKSKETIVSLLFGASVDSSIPIRF